MCIFIDTYMCVDFACLHVGGPPPTQRSAARCSRYLWPDFNREELSQPDLFWSGERNYDFWEESHFFTYGGYHGSYELELCSRAKVVTGFPRITMQYQKGYVGFVIRRWVISGLNLGVSGGVHVHACWPIGTRFGRAHVGSATPSHVGLVCKKWPLFGSSSSYALTAWVSKI